MNALANNVETVTSLVQAQSQIIENLSQQVSSVVKGTNSEKKFKQVFDKIANQSKHIHNVTKKLNKTIIHVNELAAVWSETAIKLDKRVKCLENETEEKEDEMEDMEKNILAKIEKLEQEVKALRVSLNYAQAQITSSSGGNIRAVFNWV